MKTVYCSNCGTCLSVTRKALPSHGVILDLIDPHICPDEPVPFTIEPNPLTPYVDQKFVQKLDESQPKFPRGISTEDLRDRRVGADIKSSAPPTLLNMRDQLTNSQPAHDVSEEPDDG